MRADAKKNYDHLLIVARRVIGEHGVDASLRDIARQANVGLGTLYRHFPTREALLEALLRSALDELSERAEALVGDGAPDQALVVWVREAVAFVKSFNGVVASMTAALADESSPLHASCTNLRSAGAKLLEQSQRMGTGRPDLDGVDLFALIGALGWLGEQPAFAPRNEHLFGVICGALFAPGE